MGSPWKTWQIDTAKALFAEGWSMARIAASIGLSKNAVVGKLDRMKLKRERAFSMTESAVRSRAKRAASHQKDRVTKPIIRAGKPFRSANPTPPNPVSLSSEAGEPAPGCVKLSLRSGAGNANLHRRVIECAWPIGEVFSDEFHFCSAMVAELGKPYCQEHTDMARGRG
jgi:GcrA cell cycle regulator